MTIDFVTFLLEIQKGRVETQPDKLKAILIWQDKNKSKTDPKLAIIAPFFAPYL